MRSKNLNYAEGGNVYCSIIPLGDGRFKVVYDNGKSDIRNNIEMAKVFAEVYVTSRLFAEQALAENRSKKLIRLLESNNILGELQTEEGKTLEGIQ